MEPTFVSERPPSFQEEPQVVSGDSKNVSRDANETSKIVLGALEAPEVWAHEEFH